MKFNLILFLSGICFSLLVACKSDSTVSVYTILDVESAINGSVTPVPKMEIKSIIPLETTDVSLIGNINRLEFFSDRYYILDRDHSETIFVFSSAGEFIAKTKSGKGPGELLNPWDFYIDKKNSQLLIFDQASNRISIFDKDLNFISSKAYPDLIIRNFTFLGNDTVLVLAQNPIISEMEENSRYSSYSYLIYINDFSEVYKKFFPYPREETRVVISSPFCTNNGIVFIEPLNDYIYRIDQNTNVEIIFQLDFGDYSLSKEEIQKGFDFIYSLARKGERIVPLDHVIDNHNYLAASFFYINRMHFVIHSKFKNEIYYSANLFKNGILPTCLLQGFEANVFIGVATPKDLIDYYSNDTSFDEFTIPDINDNHYLILFEIVN